MDKITFSNKVDTKITSVAEINKVTGANLNEIKDVTNLAVHQLELNTPQIASNKEDITSLINGDGKTYISISDAMAVLPLPSDNTPFTIRDSISNLEDGYYIYLSTEAGGYKFLGSLNEPNFVQNLNKQSYLVSGAIRNEGTKANDFEYWKVIDYSGHYPQGFKNITGDFSDVIETFDTHIRVHHNVGGDGTGAVVAVLDETLAQTGLRLGTSVGHLYSDIYLYRDVWGLLTKSGGSWSVSLENGIQSATWNVAGYLDIVHSECLNFVALMNQQGSLNAGDWQAQATQITSTASRVYFTKTKPLYHSARISSNGSAFSIVGTSENISIGTFSSNSLPIVFTNGDVNTFDIQLTAGAGLNGLGYLPQISSPSTGGFNLQFINTVTGGFAGSIDNKMEAFVRARSRTLPSEPEDGVNFSLRMNSRSQINPKSLDTVEYPAGNIWVFGNVVKI